MSSELKFTCSEHGEQPVAKARSVFTFGGFFRIELACGCTFDCQQDRFIYVGWTRDGWTNIPHSNMEFGYDPLS